MLYASNGILECESNMIWKDMNENRECRSADGSEETVAKDERRFFVAKSEPKSILNNRISDVRKSDFSRNNFSDKILPTEVHNSNSTPRKRCKTDNTNYIPKEHIEAACAEGYARYFLPVENNLVTQSEDQSHQLDSIEQHFSTQSYNGTINSQSQNNLLNDHFLFRQQEFSHATAPYCCPTPGINDGVHLIDKLHQDPDVHIPYMMMPPYSSSDKKDTAILQTRQLHDVDHVHLPQDDLPNIQSKLHPVLSNQHNSQEVLIDSLYQNQDADVKSNTFHQYPFIDTNVALSPITRRLNNITDRTNLSQNLISDDHSSNQQNKRFKEFHEKKWNEQLEDLRNFKLKFGHCLVPHTFDENPHLARWVKRQRRQYKLMQEGDSASTMTPERVEVLTNEGFVWDSHETVWMERFNQLQKFVQEYGHFKISKQSIELRPLTSWIKCQKRQYKLLKEGKPSSLTKDRMMMLNSIGFNWEVRSSVEGNVKSSPSYDHSNTCDKSLR